MSKHKNEVKINILFINGDSIELETDANELDGFIQKFSQRGAQILSIEDCDGSTVFVNIEHVVSVIKENLDK